MWLHPVSVKKNVQKYILPKLCLTPEIKSKYFRTGECVGIGQTTVPESKTWYKLIFRGYDFIYLLYLILSGRFGEGGGSDNSYHKFKG